MLDIGEAYITASRARTKLSKEGAKQDHDLRKIVLHANLLDKVMDRISNFQSANEIYLRSYSDSQNEAQATVTFVSDFDDDDDDDSDDSEDYYLTTEISYSDDEYYDDCSSESDDEDEYDTIEVGEVKKISFNHETLEEEEEEEESEDDTEVAWETNQLERTPSNYRSLPTIDELSEQELDDLESFETDTEDEDEGYGSKQDSLEKTKVEVVDSEESDCEGEVEECDITELNKTPSLNYSSSTDDEEEEEEESLSQANYTTTVSFNVPKFKRNLNNHQGIDSILLHSDLQIAPNIESRENVLCH